LIHFLREEKSNDSDPIDLSAGITKFASANWVSNIRGNSFGKVFSRTAIASTVGGTISKITGGKFANGARTASFAHLFNQEASNIMDVWNQKAIRGKTTREEPVGSI
jgi:hypothetical protein